MLRLLIFLVLTSAAFALEIKEVRWGFDGKVVANRFNLLSVLIVEGGPHPFEGEITLHEQRGPIDVGAPIAQPVFISPGTSRWVQFVVYVTGDNPWHLSWGRGANQRRDLDPPTLGPPATVLVVDSASVFTGTAPLRIFSEELFPTSLAALDGLDQVVLDHVPRWDLPRREAFFDWVRRGGIVHILQGTGGYPAFDGDWAAFQTSGPRARFGAGRIVRHEFDRTQCSEAALSTAGFPPRTLNKTDVGSGGPALYRFDQTLLRSLADLTKPDVQWWFLYLLTIGYLVVIGPIHYRWAQRVNYRLAIGGFLGIVAVFALAFMIGGHRGSGEKQTSHSIAIAHALGNGRWDVQQWVSAFATKGAFYQLHHEAPVNFYSATSDSEAVAGKIVGGKDGHFDVDIPLFSTRPFLHRATLSGPSAQVNVITWKRDRIELELGENFPEPVETIYARFLGKILTLQKEGRHLTGSPSGRGLDEADYFVHQGMDELQRFEWASRNFSPRVVLLPLLAYQLGSARGLPSSSPVRPLASDHLQLLVLAKSPAAFGVRGKGFDQGQGHTLYIVDVFRPADTGDTPLEPR